MHRAIKPPVQPPFMLADAALGELVARGGEELIRHLRELEWLRAISQQLTETRTLDAVLDVVYDGIRFGLGYDRVGVNLFDFEEGIFEDLIGTDSHGQKIIPRDRRVTLEPNSPIWRFPGIAALLKGAPHYYTENAFAECPPELKYLFDGEPTHNIMVPLHVNERVSGMISVDNLVSGRPIAPEEIGPLVALAGQVSRAIENARLLERERDERRRLAIMATTDPLTGLANRSLLHDRLGDALRNVHRSASQGSAQPLSLLLMDLDRFKEINDTLGHHAGDWLLQEVAARLLAVVQPSDTIARLGGDEFAVLLPTADEVTARDVAVTLCSTLEEPFSHDGRLLSIGVSVGIAVSPDHGTDSSTLLRCADVAMYVAKRTHSGHAVYSVEDDQHSPARLTLLTELRTAVADRALEIFYQPVVTATHGRLREVEALVRWPHSVHGMLTPDQFVPLAEQTGIISPLTVLVLEEAVRQCAAWDSLVTPPLSVAVNLSARSLHDPQLPGRVEAILRRNDVAPNRLIVEITESALMADPERARAVLARLSGMGVRVAIDDFGTGYSSLAYLKDLPVDIIKIDRSFVHGLTESGDSKDAAIVRSIIEMAHILGLSVVAEGVETKEVWNRLEALGCDSIQGYVLSRPVPAADLVTWMCSRDGARPSWRTNLGGDRHVGRPTLGEVDRSSLPIRITRERLSDANGERPNLIA